MLKKSLIATATLLAFGTFVFGRDVFSYAKTWGASVRDAVKSQVPLGNEVTRARDMVEDLVPDIEECIEAIARQQVDIEYLTREIGDKEYGLAEKKDAILVLRSHLASGDSKFVVARRSFSNDKVKLDLSYRFERYKVAEDSLMRNRQILAARQKSLMANEEKLDTMIASKKDLEVNVEQLEARLKTIQAAETASMINFDDSQLSRAKTLILELNKKLDVKDKLLATEGKASGYLIPFESKLEVPDENITQEIDAYFGSWADGEAGAEVAEAKPAA